ncbi:hypothetical protein PVAP13_4KG348088 [Panicum virgatum]|uniref:Tf2-1-like SH3-like domain-containing protein n=1 Tax=Panicum virgatum TaxID=38727 RepID=A0A8T0TVN4_PANVG|nr:hypothetical protein PVAP13_4KG348088 [Panicum virgatum]
MYLRCLTGDRPRQWFAVASVSGIRLQHRLPVLAQGHSVQDRVWARPPVHPILRTRRNQSGGCRAEHGGTDELLADVRYRLEQAQAVQKRHYDKNHRAVSYDVGDWAWLRLLHRTPTSLPMVMKGKLKPRYYGPYRVAEIINDVAVRLALPQRTRLHDVFHVGLLKMFVGTPPEDSPPLPDVHHGAAVPEPERAVRARLARRVRQILV